MATTDTLNTETILVTLPYEIALRHVQNPAYVQLPSTLRNVIGLDVLSFGAVGQFNPDRTFVALAARELPGADWIAVGYGMHSWRPLGVFSINSGESDRVSHSGSLLTPLASVRFPRQKLPGLTLTVLTSSGAYDTRILFCWMELIIHYDNEAELLGRLH